MTASARRILVIDIGGSHVKLRMTGQRTMTKFDSGPTLGPAAMVRGVKAATAEWAYDVISIGLPGAVAGGTLVAAPHNLGPGWVGFDFAAAFPHKVRVINDAAMQALGGYRGGRMLFLGLGTGLGAALVIEGIVQPLELAHLPYRKGDTFEDVVGGAARKKAGNHRWRRDVLEVVAMLRFAMQAESVLIGGGNVKHLEAVAERLPADTRLGGNSDAFRGGLRLWDRPLPRKRRAR